MIGFRLNNVVSSSALAQGDDVLRMKGALQGLGEYDPPAYGMTEWPDAPLFDGMKRFQRKNGLAVDGVAKPGGPTETMINTRLAEQALGRKQAEEPPRHAQNQDQDDPTDIGAMANRIAQRQAQWQKTQRQKTQPQPASQASATPQSTPAATPAATPATTPALTLRGGVGDGQGNQPDDIITLKNALAWTGHYPKDSAQLLTPILDEALTWGLHRFQRDFGLKQDGITRPNGETESRLNEVISPIIQLASLTSSVPDSNSTGPSTVPEAGVQVAGSAIDPETWGNSGAWALEKFGETTKEVIEDSPAITSHGILETLSEATSRMLPEASENLKHFLDDTGTERIHSREEARARPFIREAEETNRQRFIDGFLEDRPGKPEYEYRSHLLSMKDGDTITLPTGPSGLNKPRDEYDVNRSTGDQLWDWRFDQAFAYGSQAFASKAEQGFSATRSGDTITITGVVTHEWEDPYDFHGGGLLTGLAEVARDGGYATEFTNQAEWQQELTATLKIVNGDLVVDDYIWRDVK